MKTIAIDRSLQDLKPALEQYGYQVFYHDELDGPIDAFIYSEESNHQTFLNGTTTRMDAHHMNSSGTLLINGYQKSVIDILRTLESRTYSPLFENPVKGAFH